MFHIHKSQLGLKSFYISIFILTIMSPLKSAPGGSHFPADSGAVQLTENKGIVRLRKPCSERDGECLYREARHFIRSYWFSYCDVHAVGLTGQQRKNAFLGNA
jgi:hypothetical protein